MSNQAKREHLVETAQRLFSKHGYHGTGIDMILKESGVAKKTLYYHFQSKEELIVEVLRRYDEQFSLMVDSKVKQLAESPRADSWPSLMLHKSGFRIKISTDVCS